VKSYLTVGDIAAASISTNRACRQLTVDTTAWVTLLSTQNIIRRIL